ncbi:Transport permease protein [Gammaproteobacteria bacterium]
MAKARVALSETFVNEINWRGMATLFAKETRRFLKVLVQTVLTPVMMALLYLLVFRQVLEEHFQPYPGISYGAFLVPGLVMMVLLQNAFSNSSSSIIQSKMTGNLIFVLLAPLSPGELYLAFVAAAVVRGLLVGLGVWLAAFSLVTVPMAQPFWALLFAVLGGSILGALGLLAGIWADNFDRLAAFQNFVILPLSFLSGVFYSLRDLPPFWKHVSAFNPFLYLIDGFRHGCIGVSDTNPWFSATISILAMAMVSIVCIYVLHSGYKLRN